MASEEKSAQSEFRPVITREKVRRDFHIKKARKVALDVIKDDIGGEIERVITEIENSIQNGSSSKD